MFGYLGNGLIGPRREFSSFHPFFHSGTTGNCIRRRNLQDRVEVDQADISESDDPDEILAAIEYSVDSFLTDLDDAATAN